MYRVDRVEYKDSIEIITNDNYCGTLFCSRYEIAEHKCKKHLYVFAENKLIYSLTDIESYEITKGEVYDTIYIIR